MPTDCSLQLKSLVFATSPAQREVLISELESSASLECIDTPDDQAALRDSLLTRHYDFVVIAVDRGDERLPACLLRYPELQILVVTADRKTGSVNSWRQQGANDVVSSQRYEKLHHALERMLEDCQTRAQLRLATLKLASQDKLHKILLDTQAEALLLWQDGQILESNRCFDYLMDCNQNAARGTDWQRWLSAQSYAELHERLPAKNGDIVISSALGQKYRARIESLTLDHGTAKLVRIDPRPIDPSQWIDEQNDSVTGVLRRESFLTNLDNWLQSSPLLRYTVVQINIEASDGLPVISGANSTLQELLAYRAANLLQQQFQDDMLMGRTGRTALTLVSRQPVKDSRKLASQLRQCLGTVGDLIEDPQQQIRIKTLTLSPTALSADKVLKRLEHHPLMTRRARRHKVCRLDHSVSSLSA